MTRGDPRHGAPSPAVSLLLAVALAALLPACGGGGVTAPPTPAPPVTFVADEGTLSGVPPGGGALFSFSTARMGTLEITVQWTSPSNNLDLYLVRGPCDPAQFFAQACTIVAVSESPTAKPERLSVTNALSTDYVVFVLHNGETEESITWTAKLTSAGAASARRSP